MQFDKQQIMDLLRDRGDDQQAKQADEDLPDKVDTDDPEHQSMLQRFGIDPQELISKFTGGKGIPGL